MRFKRINYVETVQQKVFERMISERKRIAERSRSEGQGRAAEIRGQKERDVLAASSVGYRTAQELKGEADAKATAIYARAYGRDPDFYQFFKSLETLKLALDKDATADPLDRLGAAPVPEGVARPLRTHCDALVSLPKSALTDYVTSYPLQPPRRWTQAQPAR